MAHRLRSFCYVDDLVNGIISMMNKENFTGPVNLGNDGEFTVKELAEKVIRANWMLKSKIIYKDLPQDDPSRRKPDLTLAKKELNFSHTVNLESGLIKTIDYFKKSLKEK
jgi:UDP-glucuronate decarboxylase